MTFSRANLVLVPTGRSRCTWKPSPGCFCAGTCRVDFFIAFKFYSRKTSLTYFGYNSRKICFNTTFALYARRTSQHRSCPRWFQHCFHAICANNITRPVICYHTQSRFQYRFHAITRDVSHVTSPDSSSTIIRAASVGSSGPRSIIARA